MAEALKRSDLKHTPSFNWENPAIVNGDAISAKDDGKPVVSQISVNLDVISGQGEQLRPFSSARPLQELPMIRRLYSLDAVNIRPDWSARLSRRKTFTRAQFLDEKKRLYGSIEPGDERMPAYIIARENKVHNLTEETYGPAKESTLYPGMKAMEAAWTAMEARLREAVLPILAEKAESEFRTGRRPENKVFEWEIEIAINQRIKVEDIEAILKLVEPEEEFIEDAMMLSIHDPAEERQSPAEPVAIVPPKKDKLTPSDPPAPTKMMPSLNADEPDFQAFLVAAGVKPDAAEAFALIGADISDGVIHEVSPELWASVPGYTKHVKKQEALMNLLKDFRTKHAQVEA